MESGTPRDKAKTRNQRIPLGYFERTECADPWAARRKRTALVVGLSTAVLVVGVTAVPQGLRFANHGPVVDAHASFEQHCALCHRPEASMLDWPEANRNPPPHFHIADAACAQCHDAPSHFAHANLDGNEPSCFSCHQDHAGRTVDLKRTPDANCTACHSDAEGWRKGIGVVNAEFATAKAFAADLHPEFRLTKAADQNLIFSHAVHLAPGLKVGLSYDALPAEHWLRRGRSATTAVALDCSSCHERAASGTGGNDFAPVTFSRHCASCHPLKAPSYAAKDASRHHVPTIDLPHGIDGPALRELVMGSYAKQAFEGNPTLRQALNNEPSVEAAMAGRPKPKADYANLSARAEETLKRLAGGARACGECHLFEKPDVKVPFAPKVKPTGIPNRWWSRAKFSHSAHSSDCASCHKTSGGADVSTSESASDVLMPTIRNCLTCHEVGKTVVRADCVLCHGYHGVGLPDDAARHHRLTPRGAEVRR